MADPSGQPSIQQIKAPGLHPSFHRSTDGSGPDGSGGGEGQAEAAQVFVVATKRYRGEFTCPPPSLLLVPPLKRHWPSLTDVQAGKDSR